MVDECKRCGKAVRFFPLVKEEDAPGTIRGYKKTGLCVMCYREDLAKIPVKVSTELPKCTGCRRPMRPYKERKEGWPGTVARRRKNQCQSCAEKEDRGLPPWEIKARRLSVPEITWDEKVAALRVILRAGGDMLILEALGLKDVYAQVK